MGNFFYKVREQKTGKLFMGKVQADDERAVLDYLRRSNYIVIDIYVNNLQDKKDYLKERFYKHKINDKDIIFLCKQLSVTLQAGIDLLEAIKIISMQFHKKAVNEFLAVTRNKLSAGVSLASIWNEFKFLPSYIISSLYVAEQTGMLAQIFNDIGILLEREYDLKQKLMQICIYPIFLIAILIMVMTLMAFYVIPIFLDLFTKMNVQIPWITLMIFKFTILIKNNLVFLVLGIVVFSLIIRVFINLKLIKMRIIYKLYSVIYKIKLIKMIILVKIISQLNYLLAAGINIDDSLKILIESYHNLYIKENLKKIKQSLLQGMSLSKAFAHVSLSDEVLSRFIEIGEQTGMVNEMLMYLINFWNKDIDHKIKVYTQLLEPILMLILGIIICIVVIAIIVPIFNLVNSIGI